MILPTKGVRADKALLSVGALILRDLDEPKTVSRVWADLRQRNEHRLQITFDWFVLAMDVLYLMGAIDYAAGRLRRVRPVAQGPAT